jgi:hypothetical protein
MPHVPPRFFRDMKNQRLNNHKGFYVHEEPLEYTQGFLKQKTHLILRVYTEWNEKIILLLQSVSMDNVVQYLLAKYRLCGLT